jgi:hypothetical protein
MNVTTCANHPERAAIERCEVCQKPLCAYCLYYTSDGQRLCQTHADAAGAAGAFIRPPGIYAEGLIGAQTRASYDSPLLEHLNTPYRGNLTDLMAFMSMLLGVISLATCLIFPLCAFAPLSIIFGVLSLMGLKDAHDQTRTRMFAIVGVVLSIMWGGVIFTCVSLSRSSTSTFTSVQLTVLAPGNIRPGVVITQPPQIFTDTATPTPDTGR